MNYSKIGFSFQKLIKNFFSFYDSNCVNYPNGNCDIVMSNNIKIECKLVNLNSNYFKKQNPRLSVYVSEFDMDYLIIGIVFNQNLKIFCFKWFDIIPMLSYLSINKIVKRVQTSLLKILKLKNYMSEIIEGKYIS